MPGCTSRNRKGLPPAPSARRCGVRSISSRPIMSRYQASERSASATRSVTGPACVPVGRMSAAYWVEAGAGRVFIFTKSVTIGCCARGSTVLASMPDAQDGNGVEPRGAEVAHDIGGAAEGNDELADTRYSGRPSAVRENLQRLNRVDEGSGRALCCGRVLLREKCVQSLKVDCRS